VGTWGGIVTVVLGLLSAVSVAHVGGISLEALGQEKATLVELLMSAATLAAGAVALYGRVRAKARVTLKSNGITPGQV